MNEKLTATCTLGSFSRCPFPFTPRRLRKLTNATYAYLRTLSLRLTNIRNITNAAAPPPKPPVAFPSRQPGDGDGDGDDALDRISRARLSANALESKSFSDLCDLLSGFSLAGKSLLCDCGDSKSSFTMLCMSKDICEAIVRLHKGRALIASKEIFSALSALCNTILCLKVDVGTAIYSAKPAILLSSSDSLRTFVMSLPEKSEYAALLRPVLVRELYKVNPFVRVD